MYVKSSVIKNHLLYALKTKLNHHDSLRIK